MKIKPQKQYFNFLLIYESQICEK